MNLELIVKVPVFVLLVSMGLLVLWVFSRRLLIPTYGFYDKYFYVVVVTCLIAASAIPACCLLVTASSVRRAGLADVLVASLAALSVVLGFSKELNVPLEVRMAARNDPGLKAKYRSILAALAAALIIVAERYFDKLM